jgi:hypothetical protein
LDLHIFYNQFLAAFIDFIQAKMKTEQECQAVLNKHLSKYKISVYERNKLVQALTELIDRKVLTARAEGLEVGRLDRALITGKYE